MNYIPKIAEMLGVEINEHFNLKYADKMCDTYEEYFFDEDGLNWTDGTETRVANAYELRDILRRYVLVLLLRR